MSNIPFIRARNTIINLNNVQEVVFTPAFNEEGEEVSTEPCLDIYYSHPDSDIAMTSFGGDTAIRLWNYFVGDSFCIVANPEEEEPENGDA